MRCRTCEYSLWTVTSRTCPECGSSFRPSDFAFPPNSVRFECPHCRTGYVGTSQEGHLVPRAFTCAGCQTPIDMDEMVLVPLPGMAEVSESLLTNEWADRQPGATTVRWFKACRSLLFRPTRFASTLRSSDSTTQAWLFAFIGWLLAVVVGGAISTAVVGTQWSVLNWPGSALQQTVDPLVHVGIGVVLAFLAFPVLAIVVAVIHHLVMIFLVRDRGGFGASLQATLYASGATSLIFLLGWLAPPFTCFCLPVIGAIWFIPTTMLLAHLHRTTTMRALLAAAAPIVVLCLSCFACMGTAMYSALSMSRTAMSQMTPPNLPAGASANGFNSPILTQVLATPGPTGAQNPFEAAITQPFLMPGLVDLITEETKRPVRLTGIDIASNSDSQALQFSQLRLAFKNANLKPPYRIGSLVVYADASSWSGDFTHWAAVWRTSNGEYVVATLFQQYRMSAKDFATYLRSEMARRKGAGQPMVHPNQVPDVADATDPFLPSEIEAEAETVPDPADDGTNEPSVDPRAPVPAGSASPPSDAP